MDYSIRMNLRSDYPTTTKMPAKSLTSSNSRMPSDRSHFKSIMKNLTSPSLTRRSLIALLCLSGHLAFSQPDRSVDRDLAEHFGGSAGAATNAVTVSIEGDFRVFHSNGMPNHETGAFPNPGN